MATTGTVYLIGAGPGDPGLITVRGRELLETADVVVYDRLAHPALLKHARDDAGEAGTRAPGAAEGRRDWAKIAHAADTLIFLMGVEALPDISARLQEHGRSGETPVALVQWGTWTKQRVVTGTLASIVEEVKRAGITPPAVCVVGEVVKLRDALRWFDDVQTRP